MTSSDFSNLLPIMRSPVFRRPAAVARTLRRLRLALCALLTALLLWLPTLPAAAQESFVVEDIRIEGLGRVSPGVIFNLLPLGTGDTLAAAQAAQIIQVLFETGFFREVNILRDGNVLVVKVEENPTIAEVSISGIEELAEERVLEMLSSAGIAKAKVFNQGTLEGAAQVLENEYINRNYYHVEVETVVSPLPRNRVALLLKVTEGEEAFIRSIQLVGNTAFSDWRLHNLLRMQPRGVLNYLTEQHRYSEQKLQADLARLRTHYLEAGYLRFAVTDWQVEISPDKRAIDIVLRLEEGKRYRVSGTSFESDTPLQFNLQDAFAPYVLQQPGDVFSGELAAEAVSGIRAHLGKLGYANAQVTQEADIDDASGTAEVRYRIRAKQIATVRRIEIIGNEFTADEVIRRELLQFEAEQYSQEKIDRSRSRVRRLGYFERVEIFTLPVAGSTDQVDLQVRVEEANTGQVRFGAGFGTDGGVTYNFGLSNRNIFGTGNDFSADLGKSEDNLNINFRLDERYYTKEGITRHMAFNLGETSSGDSTSEFTYDGYKGEFGFDFPFTDDGIYHLYLAYEQIEIKSARRNTVYQEFLNEHGTDYQSLLLEGGLVHDTRDAASLPTAGQRIRLSGKVATPLLDLSYYQIDYLHDYYRSTRLPGKPVLHLRAGAGLGGGYGGGVYPFYKRYYLGGFSSLRGFDASSIGASADANGDAIGGKSRLYGSAELAVPLRFFREQQIFLVPFADAGAVGEDAAPEEMRASAGLELRWISPVGPLRFVYALPLRDEDGDSLQAFQFSVSTF